MKDRLRVGKRVITDNSYMEVKAVNLSDAPGKEDYHRSVRGRHEGMNGPLKWFRMPTTSFRHNKDRIGLCFFAVANIAEEAINAEERLFDIIVPSTDAEVQYENGRSGL